MNTLAGFFSWRPRGLPRVPLALLAVLTVLGTGCGSDPEPQPPPLESPQVTESTQSAVNVLANGKVTFHVAASDNAQRPLGFSWEANEGVLGQPTSTSTASDVTWSGPACLPAGTRIQVKVTITNEVAPVTTQTFPLSVIPCPTDAHVAAGLYSSVVGRPDGTIWAWGYGVASTTIPAPRQVLRLAEVRAVAAGSSFALALSREGTVWAWGHNDLGQLGNGTTNMRETPDEVPGLTNIIALAAGGSSALALRADGTVWAWGDNALGQLGDGTTLERHAPVQVRGVSRATAIATSGEHSLAVLADGTVLSWGSNSYGQLGNGKSGPGADSSSPGAVARLTNVASVSASNSFSLAMHVDGTVSSWGTDVDGALGKDTPRSGKVPGLVPQVTRAISVSAGIFYSLALLEDGTVQAWGTNDAGQLGDGTYTRHLPAPVPELAGVTALAAGGYHGAAILTDGSVRVWGANGFSQLGIRPDAVNRDEPVQVQGLTDAIRVSAASVHSLALRADGTVWAWGKNSQGELGIGEAHGAASTPTRVPGLTAVKDIASGREHSLAVLANGTVMSWGDNYRGQLGHEDILEGRMTPGPIAGLTGVTAVAAGPLYSLALRENGTVWAWGDNAEGQLGDGTHAGRLTPAEVAGLTQVAALSAGQGHVLAVRADGTVWAWGANADGQLGDGTTTAHATPAQVPGLTGVVAVAAGRVHSLALREDGTVWAWGGNIFGQLGEDLPWDRRLSPAQVVGLTGVQRIAAGDSHSMATLEGAPLVTFGINLHGELGLGAGTQGQSRGQIPSLAGTRAVAAGNDHSLAVAGDGTVWAWGANASGQLGNGEAGNSSRPITVTLKE